jgi:peptide deformylase
VDKATLRALADEMFDLMYQDDGVGLAAPQVGVNIRLMVFNEHGPPARGGPSETVLVNPEIVLRSRRTAVDEEGCLSFPKIYAGVEVRL